MIIALDYDGTYTEDPISWDDFISYMMKKGHEIVVVTMRYESEAPEFTLSPVCACRWFFTGRKAKKPFMHNLGIKPNIWIDDHPQSVFLDAEQIWGVSLPEGHTDSNNAVRD